MIPSLQGSKYYEFGFQACLGLKGRILKLSPTAFVMKKLSGRVGFPF